MIKAITVKLHVKSANGVDAFNNPVFTETTVDVPNVLVGLPETEAETRAMDLYGKRLSYTLGIPKGDTNVWTDSVVEFFGGKFRTFGFPEEGIEANIPGPWHKKVMVERYE